MRWYSRLPNSDPGITRLWAPAAALIFVAMFSDAVSTMDTLRAAEARKFPDIEYARAGDLPLTLDLYLPSAGEKPPLIVWVHGGAWRRGSKKSVPILPLVERGFAIASVDYRLSPVAPFPAQVHDIKAALRFLRANAKQFAYDPQRIAIAGASAGGHLAALVGVSGAELEGQVGTYDDVSSAVKAIVSFYGASNLETILAQSTPHGLGVRIPALQLLLGGQPDDRPEVARSASPVAHVDRNDPPLLLIHGDQDPQMPINQSHELQGRYEQLALPVEMIVVHGAAHGGAAFYTDRMLDRVAQFLRHHGL